MKRCVKIERTEINSEKDLFDNYLVITIVNKRYLKIFELWYHYFKSTGYHDILRVITVDRESEKFVSEKSIKTIYLNKTNSDFYQIIMWRFEIISKLIREGKNVIHTDSDAFWLKPDLPKIIKKGYDIQVSIGFGIPIRALEKWDFTLCTGFLIIKSNPRTIKFMDLWLQSCHRIEDDQIAFNEVLLDGELKWEFDNRLINRGRSEKFDLNIEAIDYFTVARTVEENISIFHPFLPSNNQNLKIIDLIKRLKLINNESFLDDYLNKILFDPYGWIISGIDWIIMISHKIKKKWIK